MEREKFGLLMWKRICAQSCFALLSLLTTWLQTSTEWIVQKHLSHSRCNQVPDSLCWNTEQLCHWIIAHRLHCSSQSSTNMTSLCDMVKNGNHKKMFGPFVRQCECDGLSEHAQLVYDGNISDVNKNICDSIKIFTTITRTVWTFGSRRLEWCFFPLAGGPEPKVLCVFEIGANRPNSTWAFSPLSLLTLAAEPMEKLVRRYQVPNTETWPVKALGCKQEWHALCMTKDLLFQDRCCSSCSTVGDITPSSRLRFTPVNGPSTSFAYIYKENRW